MSTTIQNLRDRLRAASVTKNVDLALGSIIEYINQPTNDVFDTWWMQKEIDEALLAKDNLQLLLDTSELDYEDLLHHCETTLREDSEDSELSSEEEREVLKSDYYRRMGELVAELASISKQIVDLNNTTDQT